VRACNRPGELRYYPGSPVLAHHLLRPQDRLTACELEPGAAAALSRHLHGSPAAKVTAIDGWVALNAFVPPKERRGLVIVDPSFEQPDDLIRLADGVTAAWRKWSTGIYLLWYPLSARGNADYFSRKLRRAGIEKCIRLAFVVAAPQPDGGLQACGLVVVNPPWRLATEIKAFSPLLIRLLERDGNGCWTLDDLSAAATGAGA
jgi:23S rRNA (adenine2030-N6)-methyltransferase